ncbi:MAG: DDE transposase, partial [bacterium]|nr:DDE transposase [bacterium]
ANRARLKSGVGREAMRRRGEMVERSFAHVLDRGGMRRTWLRGRDNVHKRYLIHVAGFNLSILMRALFGRWTPRGAASAKKVLSFVIHADNALAFIISAEIEGETAILLVIIIESNQQ